MRIVYIAAGAGGMYCGACARDIALVRKLIARGHDLEMVRLYTPIRTDDSEAPVTGPIFFGGINVILQEKSWIARRVPASVDRVLDNPRLLEVVSRRAIETRPSQLGPMAVSVLSGNKGRQRKEYLKLLGYLESRPRPDIVNITNSLLSGLAPELKTRIGAPVVCTLQGEDGFVEAMSDPHRSQARQLIQDNARAIDCFISPNEAYARKMTDYLNVPEGAVRIVRPGIEVDSFRRTTPRITDPLTIGYLSVITPLKGLDVLVDAFAMLVNERCADAILRVAGRVLNKGYWKAIRRKLAARGLAGRFEYLGEVDFSGKLNLLRQCSVFCVPSRIAESRGVAVMEAVAAGVPVVVPDSGVFPEMIALTGGGTLFPSEDVAGLADALEKMMDDPAAADEMGRAGAERTAEHYSADRMAEQVLREYDAVIRGEMPARTP